MNGGQNKRATLLVTVAVFLQVFLSAVDTNIVSTAMPTVVAALGGLHLYSWVFTAYLIASTLATPIAGKLSDEFSRKKLYLISITAFLGASMLCGQAPTMMWLILFRCLQGVAGGTMFAISLGLIGVLYPPHQRGKVQGYISSLWAIASVIGPPIGGYVVQHLSWRWAFYLNLPLGLIAIFFIGRYLREPQLEARKQRIDFAGAIVLSVAIVCLLLAITNIGRLSRIMLAGLLAVAIGMAVVLFRLEKRAESPILPLKLLGQQEIAAANLASLTTAFGVFGLIIFAPLFVQGVLAGTPSQAGIVLLPLSLGWASGSFIAGHAINRLGYRNLASGGALLMVAGFIHQILWGMEATLFNVSTTCIAVGLGMGMATNAITVAVQNSVREKDIGVATASTIFSRALGAAVGVSILGVILASRVASELKGILADPNKGALAEVRALLLPETRAQIPTQLHAQLQHGLAGGLQVVFFSCAIVCFVAFVVALRVSSGRPQPR